MRNMEVSQSPQEALDELCIAHFNQQRPYGHGRFTKIPDKLIMQKIEEITKEKVYCGISIYHYKEVHGYKFPCMFYKTAEGLLKTFPALKKYPNWEKLFDRIGESNCYLLKDVFSDFIVKESADEMVRELLS